MKAMLTRGNKILILFSVLAIFQIAWHWFLAMHNEVAGTLLRLYLHYNPATRKGVAGFFDLDLPAVALGLLIGRIGWQWSMRKLFCFVVAGGSALMALLPLYIVFFDKLMVWWWPKTDPDMIRWLFREWLFTLFLLGVFVYGGRNWGAQGKSLNTETSEPQVNPTRQE